MAAPSIPRRPPTPSQLRIMAAYARLGSQKMVANELGISTQTVKNQLADLYVRLEIEGGVVNALQALGWIRVPPTHGLPPCGWLAYCGRPDGHHGQHGGYRPFVMVPMEGASA